MDDLDKLEPRAGAGRYVGRVIPPHPQSKMY